MMCGMENPIISIVGIQRLRWKGGRFNVAPRPYNALAFRLSGTGEITAGDVNCSVKAGDVLFLPQNMAYTAEYSDTDMIVIHFTTQYDDPEIMSFVLSNGEGIYKMFLNALTIWVTKEPVYETLALASIYKIVGSLLQEQSDTIPKENFSKAVSFINQQFRNSQLNVSAICKTAGISETTLRQLFKKYYNKSPHQYVIDLRTEYARTMISCGATIESAALDSGFTDAKYFARVIKKQFGCTPRELKNYGR